MNIGDINNLRSITSLSNSRGFTIVELLIVIVVIGILAAIIIVAFNGVQNEARTKQSMSAANSVVKKAEAYNADSTGGNGTYPATFSLLSNAATSASYAIQGIALRTSQFVSGTAPATPATVAISTCTSPAGWRVYYYDYATGQASTPATSPEYGGATDASACGTTFLAS